MLGPVVVTAPPDSPHRPGRIGYLISQYPSFTHTFILREVRGLRALGWDIQTVSIADPDRPAAALLPDERAEYERTLYVKGAAVWRLASAHLLTMLRRPLAYLAGLLFALRLGHPGPRKLLYFAEAVVAGHDFERLGYRHVHVHFSSTVALIMSRVFSVSFSVTLHGPDEFDDPTGFALREKVQAAALTVAISQFGQSQLMRFSGYADWKRLAVCRLGIQPAAFERASVAQAATPFRFVSVGRLAPVKGQHILLEAMALLVKRDHAVALSIGGGGPEMDNLRAHVAALGLGDVVTLEGWCDQARVKAMYAASDAFVLASFAEGIPVVLMEAMAMRLPCVATRVMGVPELVEDGVSGLLATPSDAVSLADAMERLITDPALRARLAEAGREKVLRDYDLDRNIPELGALFAGRLGDRLN